MADWADKITEGLLLYDDGYVSPEPVAAALRNARAGGMEYVATYFQAIHEALDAGAPVDVPHMFKTLFAKIERTKKP